MLFDSRTVYLGASRDKYEQYCKALDSEKIKYKTKRVNHEEKMIAPGRGTARSMGGNFGTDKTLYEIMVGEKDYDNEMLSRWFCSFMWLLLSLCLRPFRTSRACPSGRPQYTRA